MPVATIDDVGMQFAYEDSGAPPNSTTYVTLVLCHGAIFHGAFKPLFAFVSNHNLRLVAVTLRDYPGSSPFTSAELDALRSPEPGTQALAIRDRGHELAAFLAWFVKTENIPPLVEGGDEGNASSGGLAVLGWSSGNCVSLSLLAHADSLPSETQTLLERYMRTILIYDPPHFVLGAPDPFSELNNPLQNPSVPPTEKASMFALWVSSYFSHSPSTLSTLSFLPRAEFFAGLSKASMADAPASFLPTISRMSAAELAATADFTVILRSHRAIMGVDRGVYGENARRALGEKTVWPRVQAVFMWCDMSPPEIVYAAWYFQNVTSASRPADARRVTVKRMEGVNHFPHWDRPESTLEFLVENI